MGPRTVLYVHSSADLYGSDRTLYALVTRLDRSRYIPLVLLPEDGPLRHALEERGVETHVVPLSVLHRTLAPGYWLRFWGQLPGSVRKLTRELNSRQVSLVHSNTSHVFDGALAARMAGIPHLWHIREPFPSLRPIGILIRHLAQSLSQHVLCVSEAVRRDYFPSGGNENSVGVLYDGVDLTQFTPEVDGSPVRRELGLSPDAPVVGMAGRIAAWKGHRLFLEMAARLIVQVPGVHFLVVGDAVTPRDRAWKSTLLAQVKQLDLTERVHFIGVRQDMPQVMAALDVLVHPSLMPEPWGMVVLEAMATGKPVVATGHGGPVEMICHGETGYLVPPHAPDILAACVGALLSTPEMGRQMGLAGRRRCEAYFGVERTSQLIQDIYDRIIAVSSR
ncbi:MAG: hypothetical protein KatS3mg050_3812 [Litorilinea sp.]|nr:MAG: hypothetical protein KatS3mg050_3812 [Litorilinea sp.]